MSLQPLSTGRKGRSAAYDDPQVSKTIARLRTQINNLADKDQGKSLLLSDCLQYYVKPQMKQILATGHQGLQAIWTPLPTQKQRTKADGTPIQTGSPHWSWLLHAIASEIINRNIEANEEGIFGPDASKGLRLKYETGFRAFQGKHPSDYFGAWNYVKRTFSRPIKSWYITNRLNMINSYGTANIREALNDNPAVKTLLNVALQSRRAWTEQNNMTPGKYIRTQLNGIIPVEGYNAPTTFTPPTFTRTTTLASSIQPFGLSDLTQSTAPSNPSSSSAPPPTPTSSANPFGHLGPRVQQTTKTHRRSQ